MSSTINETIADVLAAAGTDTAFGMPGGGNNLDLIAAAEAAGIRFVLAHAETPAAIMAAVYGDLTDTPAACIVTRGPGAVSASNGMANALLDRQQLVLVTDAVSAADAPRIAHQRIDQRRLFSPLAKWSATAGSGAVASTLQHAVAEAMAAPRGPVHLDFDPTAPSTPPPPRPDADPAQAGPDPAATARVAASLASARRPVVLLGVGARSLTGPVRDLVRGTEIPVLMTYRAKGVIPDSWPNSAGLLTGATTEGPLLAAADLIVLIGVDTVELIPAGWPYPAPVVSVAAWPETSPYLVPDVEVVGDLAELVEVLHRSRPVDTGWGAAAGRAHRTRETGALCAAGQVPVAGLSPQEVVATVRTAAPAGTTATVDAGAHMLPAMTLWDTEEPDEVLISSGLATMGFALPAAIAAALARPGRRVVCFTGDGGLGMCLGELETLRRLDLPVTVVLFNDARLSLIAIKAKEGSRGSDTATEYRDTDFAAVARGYGLRGRRVDTVAGLREAVLQAQEQPGPTLVDVRVDPAGYPEILAAVRGVRQG